MKLYCFDIKKGKNIVAGDYNSETKTFIKKAAKNHYMVMEKGYGISNDILTYLSNVGCTTIHIKIKTGVQISSLEDWLRRPIKNYGHGPQRFLGGRNG